MSDPTPGPAVVAPVAPPTPPEPPPPESGVDRVESAISGWFHQHIHNSPIAQATAAYNHLLSVLPHLKQALSKEI